MLGELERKWRNKDLDINLVNATEGGAFIEGFEHMSLDAFTTSRNLDRKTGEKQIYLEGKANISKTTINAYLLKISKFFILFHGSPILRLLFAYIALSCNVSLNTISIWNST